MARLFELVGEYNELYEMMTDPEIDEDVLLDTLEGIEGEIEVKAEGYLSVIDRINMEITACEQQKTEWEQRLTVRQNRLKTLKRSLALAMDLLNVKEINAGQRVIKLQTNGGVQPMDVDKDAVPDNYQRIIYEPDMQKIRAALEEGKELPFARLEPRGKHIRIK